MINNTKKVLVLATNYPSPVVPVALNYIHTRNLFYIENGINVVVLNFSAKASYKWEGIDVICLNEYQNKRFDFDVLISHAPNLRNHYIFLRKYEKRFNKILFFFHGHEVLFRSRTYSKQYFFIKTNKIRSIKEDVYDRIKLKIWSKYLPLLVGKSYYIFVSTWMFNQFKRWTNLDENALHNKIRITYNGIGKKFENVVFDREKYKKYDFITIRSNLDGSKYAIDIVCKLAQANPNMKFLLIGKGKYFQFNVLPQNIDWIDQYCDHDMIIDFLNTSRCALMPTRTDAQGLMACEIASTGMPLITSDIDVCHEIFEGFNNIEYINNDDPDSGFLKKYSKLLEKNVKSSDKYYTSNTTKTEVELIKCF